MDFTKFNRNLYSVFDNTHTFYNKNVQTSIIEIFYKLLH